MKALNNYLHTKTDVGPHHIASKFDSKLVHLNGNIKTHQVAVNLKFTEQNFLCTENFQVALNTHIKKKKKS